MNLDFSLYTASVCTTRLCRLRMIQVILLHQQNLQVWAIAPHGNDGIYEFWLLLLQSQGAPLKSASESRGVASYGGIQNV
jgi:hypothetical protein